MTDANGNAGRRAANALWMEVPVGGRPWRLLVPPVYRYLPSVYVDGFFETGEIRLSTIDAFKSYKDEARGDPSEGQTILFGIGSEQTVFAVMKHSSKAFIMSAAANLSRSIMSEFDGAEAAIEIFNVGAFADEIGRQLVGFAGGLSGPCIYGTGQQMHRELSRPIDVPEGGGAISPGQLDELADTLGQGEAYLVKDRKFAYQAEYRFIWITDEVPPKPLIVKAPLARQYCRKMKAADII